MLSVNDKKVLHTISKKLGVSSNDLYHLIQFESGFNPYAKNPYSGAMGLIQFTNTTAKRLGFNNALHLVNTYPTIKDQLLYPVYNYLKQYKPFTGTQSLFMAVFYPKYRYVSPYKQFPDYVQKLNPNIKTPQDYINKVFKTSPMGILPLLFLLGGVYLFIKGNKTNA